MRICYLANTAISHTKKWAQYFAERGHEVHIISHSKNEIDGVKVHYIDYNMKNFPLKAVEVHRLIKKINPDVLHSHQANTCGFYGATMKGYPFIVSAWGSDILVAPERSKIMKQVVKFVLKRAEYITSDSFFMSEKIYALGGAKEKVYTFPMGVEKDIFNYRRDYDNHEKGLSVVSLRNLENIYNINVIIEGFANALKMHPDMTLTIGADGTERGRLEGIVKERHLENSINFIGRYKPENVGKILKENDVFISIPSSDATSVSLLEAMAVGVYPVVSDLPANREWVNHNQNGIILEHIDSECVTKSLCDAAENLQKLKSAAEINIDIIKKRAVWDNNALTVEDIYKKCLE